MQPHRLLVLALAGLATLAPAADPAIRLTIHAGNFERRQTIVRFHLPREAIRYQTVRNSQGTAFPVQVEADGVATFIVDALNSGTQENFVLSSAEPTDLSRVTAKRDKTKLKLSSAGRLLAEYQAEPGELPRPEIKPLFQRGGYLHPLYSPSGRPITDDFAPNHVHHHGVWWSWTKTEFEDRQPDFWNMGEGKGRVEFLSLDETWSGPVHAGFVSRHRFVDLTVPEPKTALLETWRVQIYHTAEGAVFWILDLDSTQACATPAPLKLPEYRYGGLGLRGHRSWDGKNQVAFLTSEGETDREKGNTSRGRWCDMSGSLDGAQAGIAILGHPDNFRAPQPMRLHPTEPFFCFAPQQLGGMAITPGKPYVSRYRLVVHDGPPDKALLDRLWNDYAHPPQVIIQKD